MSNNIPKEHQLKCGGCGKMLDMREVSILCHGWIEDGEIVCYDDSNIPKLPSRQIGSSTEWTKDKKRLDLN